MAANSHDLPSNRTLGSQDDFAVSDDRYKSFIEHLPVLFYAVDSRPPYSPLYVSPAFSRFGYPLDFWLNDADAFTKVIHPEDLEWVFHQTAQSTLTGEDVDYEYRIIDAKGDTHWVRDRGTLIRDAKGEVIYREGVMLDVTSRKHTEEQYHDLFENANDLIYTHDLNGNFTSLNRAGERITGYTREEALTMNIADLVAPDSLVAAHQMTQKKLHDEVATTYEINIIAHGGRIVSLELSTRMILIKGVPVGVQGIGRDVSERKRGERALKESENRYRQLGEGISHQVWTANPNGRLDYVNSKTLRYFNKTHVELIGEGWQNVVHPDDLAESIKRWSHSIETGEYYEVEFRLRSGDGQYRWHKSRATCGRDTSGEITKWFGTNTDIDDQKITEEKLNYYARHDTLTNLPNRVEFMNHLRAAIERADENDSAKFAVLFLDLDRFKVVNDSLGHLVGDKLLIAIADRLRTYVRPGDVVARLGGDEFTILLNRTGGEDEIKEIAERVQRNLSKAFRIDNYEVFTSASIGIIISDEIMREPEDFLRDADSAMYRAKEAGKARYEVFDREMHVRNMNLLQIETDLRHALDRNEFEVLYQPIVDLKTGSISEFEALIRWRHPQLGLITPDEFVSVAEETGMIVGIGQWVLEQACWQVSKWQKNLEKDLTVSVNLSAKQLMHPAFIKEVMQILHKSGLQPRQLKLEVTENTVMEHSEKALSVLNELNELGISLATDDFGTGYSSLSYLQRFPFDRLKIDRSFIDRMDSDEKSGAIVKTILMLGENLGIQVVAEGVETQNQLDHLLRLGCQFGQGYFFARPANAVDARELIRGSYKHAESPFVVPQDSAAIFEATQIH